MTRPSGSFFDRYNAFFDHGWSAALSPIDASTWLAYLRYSDNESGKAFPKLITVAKAVGHSTVAHVQRSRARLVRWNLLTILDGGGGRKPATVRVEIPSATLPPDLAGARPRRSRPPAKLEVGIPPSTSEWAPPAKLEGAPPAKSEDAPPSTLAPASIRTAQEQLREQRKERSAGKPEHGAVMRHYVECFTRRYSVAPTIMHGRDGKHIKTILDAVGRDETKAKVVVGRYLADDDDFVVNARHPLGICVTRIDRYRIDGPTQTNGRSHGHRRKTAAERGEFAEPRVELPFLGARRRASEAPDPGEPAAVSVEGRESQRGGGNHVAG